jgi:hypothetical protein
MPKQHSVQQGESLSLLADKYGLSSTTLWEDPANSDLKSRRPDPNALLAGDIVSIPDMAIKSIEVGCDKKHSFKRLGVPATFVLQLFDVLEPRANVNYSLVVDGEIKKGKTDAEGILKEFVPVNAKKGELILESADNLRVDIEFGHLDPLSEISGVQMRLNNLGFYVGESTGKMNEATQSALAKFQGAHNLQVSGEVNDETLKKLEEMHDHAS